MEKSSYPGDATCSAAYNYHHDGSKIDYDDAARSKRNHDHYARQHNGIQHYHNGSTVAGHYASGWRVVAAPDS